VYEYQQSISKNLFLTGLKKMHRIKLKLQKIDKVLAAWIIIVLFAIAWPSPELPKAAQFDYSDKIAHMILFGIVTFLVNRSMSLRGFGQKTASIMGFLTGSAYAGLAEIIQIFVPGRDCSLYDFYAGVLGAGITVIVINFIKCSCRTNQ
jgi:VanZ family protein